MADAVPQTAVMNLHKKEGVLAVVKRFPENGLKSAKINQPPFLCSLKMGQSSKPHRRWGGGHSIKACS